MDYPGFDCKRTVPLQSFLAERTVPLVCTNQIPNGISSHLLRENMYIISFSFYHNCATKSIPHNTKLNIKQH